MSPKFRGDSNSWLDEQRNSTKVRGSKKGKKQQGFVPRVNEAPSYEQANGVVEEVFPNQCRVAELGAGDGEGFLCKYRRVGIKSGGPFRERSPVAVGDRVVVEKTGKDSGVISQICERRNTLTRPAPGAEMRDGKRVHVLAANIELVVIVASALEPEFTPGLVDRFLIAAQAEKIPVLICVTKVDLIEKEAPKPPKPQKPWMHYSSYGYEVVEISNKTGMGMADLVKKMKTFETVFCGHSGVGKTSLLQKLLNKTVGKTGDVNEQTGRGRHTTTSAVRYRGPESQGWVDTPGVREFGLTGIAPEELKDFFPELKEIECESPSCIHRAGEVGCRAVDFLRYSSYQRILESLFEKIGEQ